MPFLSARGSFSGNARPIRRNRNQLQAHAGHMNPPMVEAEPASRRIESIDLVRGFALLGILIMNIPFFAGSGLLPELVETSAEVTESLLDTWIYWLSSVLAEQKFLTIFSLLYGTGIVLLVDRLEDRGQRATAIFMRRSLWLFAFGLLHYVLLWDGDILTSYATAGVAAFFLRHCRATVLLVLGLIILNAGMVADMVPDLFLNADMVPELLRAELLQEAVSAVEADQGEDAFTPLPVDQGIYWQNLQARIREVGGFIVVNFFSWSTWRGGGFMLLGMAAGRMGVFTGERSTRFYMLLAATGLVVGLGLEIWGFVTLQLESDMYFYFLFLHAWGSLCLGVGYVGLVMLWARQGWLAALRRRLAAVGRTAFTNYIAHSVLCTLIFYDIGLGLFDKVSLAWQMAMVLAIWILQLAISPWWLERHRYGPLEWLWRSLTYNRRVPLRGKAA